MNNDWMAMELNGLYWMAIVGTEWTYNGNNGNLWKYYRISWIVYTILYNIIQSLGR